MKSLWRLLQQEWQLIYRDPAIVMVLGGGILFYAFLYPLPYSKNVPGEQAVAVVDLDHSSQSRKLVRMVGATPQVRVVAHPSSLEEARQLLAVGEAQGLLVIPESFQKHLFLGLPTTLSYAGDASYFLIYSNIAEGLLTAGGTLTAESQVRLSVMRGQDPATAIGEALPVRLSGHPVFNPGGVYLSYIVPAVFVLILHQTLLIAAGCVTVKDRLRRKQQGEKPNTLAALGVRWMLFSGLYLFFAMLYFGFFFAHYEIVRVASLWQLMLFTLLFISVTTVFAIALGYVLQRPELPTVLVLVSSLPIVFTAGFVWPVGNLPQWLDMLSWLIPAKSGIQGLLLLNQMGAPVSALLSPMLILLAQGFSAALLLVWLSSREKKEADA